MCGAGIWKQNWAKTVERRTIVARDMLIDITFIESRRKMAMGQRNTLVQAAKWKQMACSSGRWKKCKNQQQPGTWCVSTETIQR